MEIKFIPLSFINSHEEILKQIKNTVLIAHLFDQYKETTLEYYLESTQYGYTASALESGKHKLVRITDINDGSVNWDTVPFCDCDVEDKYLLKDDDILVARTGGTTGKSFIVNNPPNNAVFASYLIRLRLNDKADIDFITYFLNSYAFWSQIIEMKAGSAMPNVNAEKLKTLKLPKCDLKIQKEIISIFNNSTKINGFQFLFDKVSSIEQLFFDNKSLSIELIHQLSLVKKLRQQFLQEAVQGKLVSQDPKDEPASELLKKIKAEKLKLISEKKIKKEKELPPIKKEEIPFEIPENWTWCRGEIIASYIDPQPSHRTPPESTDGIPYVAMSDIKKDGSIDFRSTRKVSNDTLLEHQNRYNLEIGDFIFGKIGTIGKPVKLSPPFNYTLSANIILIQPQRKIINQDYLFYFLSSPAAEKNLIENKSTMSYPVFGMGKARNMPIPLPPLEEQNKIVEKLNELMQTCDELEESIKQSASQNEKLLQQVLREALRKEVVEKAMV